MYENVYDEQIKRESVGTAAMLRMIDDADVVINETVNREFLVTKPENGYNGIGKVADPRVFADEHPNVSVLFIQYAGGINRYNLKNA